MRPNICKQKGVYLAQCSECDILRGELSDLQEAVEEYVKQLNGRIDESIIAWFGNGEPTLVDEPAIGWTTTEEQDEHLSDLYFDLDTGHIYRFMKDDTYKWELIRDKDVTDLQSAVEELKKRATALEQKDKDLEARDAELEQKDKDLEATDTEQQGAIEALQAADKTLTEKDEALQSDIDALKAADQALTEKDNAQQGLIEALQQADTDFQGKLDVMQNEIDGNIATWFYPNEPTPENEPASTWTDTETKNKHLSDLFYDTTTGYVYRWMLEDGVYKWQIVEDTDTTKLLADVEALKQKDADLEAADKTLTEKDTAQQTEIDALKKADTASGGRLTALEAADTQFQTDLTALQEKVDSLNVPEGGYVKTAGDTMTGPLTTPGLTVAGVDMTITSEEYSVLVSLIGGV